MSEESKILAGVPDASRLPPAGASGYPHPIIAREGWSFIAVSVMAAGLAHWLAGAGWAAPLWLVTLFMVQFFRDPPRAVPQDLRAVLSPADGRVVTVERTRDPYLERDALKMSVFMNVFNAHSNRSPVDGEIRDAWHHPGKFFNAALSKSSLENERAALWIRTAGGADVTCVQIAGLIARRILCYAQAGNRLARGERYGFIRFGSRVDVYMPLESRPVAAVGDKVYATETILAVLP
ncbi:MAG: phosphatidylserine decarboxylase [Betaproteobacteria bacterium]|nr:phosphatidylserine decarboxylase [Betaproteobacteria bacterium]MBI2508586.1 phosphatidylserine decarboxylase [Betaproteobacteria bacterium]